MTASASENPPWHFDGDKFVDEADRNVLLPAPFDQIKKDYYQQVFIDEGYDTDMEYFLDHPFEFGCPSLVPNRYVSINSFQLSSFYGVFDGAYLVAFAINGLSGSDGGPFGSIGVTFYGPVRWGCYPRTHPYFWKDGIIYSLDQAYQNDLVSAEEFQRFVLRVMLTDDEDGPRWYPSLAKELEQSGTTLTWDEVLEEPTTDIKLGWEEYIRNLPPAVE